MGEYARFHAVEQEAEALRDAAKRSALQLAQLQQRLLEEQERQEQERARHREALAEEEEAARAAAVGEWVVEWEWARAHFARGAVSVTEVVARAVLQGYEEVAWQALGVAAERSFAQSKARVRERMSELEQQREERLKQQKAQAAQRMKTLVCRGVLKEPIVFC